MLAWIYDHIINTIYFVFSIIGLLVIGWFALFTYCLKTDRKLEPSKEEQNKKG